MIKLKKLLNEETSFDQEKLLTTLNTSIDNLVNTETKKLVAKLKGKHVSFSSTRKVEGIIKDIKYVKDGKRPTSPYNIQITLDNGNTYDVLSSITIMESKYKLTEAKNKYLIGGDPYDGGVDCIVYVNGKKVYKGWRAGDHDWTYKKKDYEDIYKLLDQIAKDNGLQSHKDFKRKEI